MNFLSIIPARYASTRFPGKPLVEIQGKPMIQWVYERTSAHFPDTWVATDDKRIFDAMYATDGFGERELEALYGDYLEMKKNSRKVPSGSSRRSPPNSPSTSKGTRTTQDSFCRSCRFRRISRPSQRR